MISSSPREYVNSADTTTLAPVIPLRSAHKENGRPVRKVSKLKEDSDLPLFYTRPIFKTKKYDLL